MKVACWWIGKTSTPYLREGIEEYHKRLKHYLPFDTLCIPDIRRAGKMDPEQLKAREAELVLQRLGPEDHLILLDEGGRQYSSEEFAVRLDQLFQRSSRRLIFLVGGAYGFSDALYSRANGQLSLSTMTFSHQMIRLFFLEQLYRGMTILRNQPYHNS